MTQGGTRFILNWQALTLQSVKVGQFCPFLFMELRQWIRILLRMCDWNQQSAGYTSFGSPATRVTS